MDGRMVAGVLSLVALVGLGAQTRKPTLGGNPRVSPNGARILFGSDRSGMHQLYLMDADGSHVAQLTTDTAGAFSGDWSPDGAAIVYVAHGVHEQIVVIRPDGTGRRVISDDEGNQAPSWSPDGKSILFAAGKFPQINIHAMNADGTNRRNLAPNPGFDYDPAWSPDGKTIALVTGTRGVGVRIYAMNPDGTGRRRLTASDENEERPIWSPDGKRIAFQSSTRGSGPTQAYIHVVDVATGEDRRVGSHQAPQLDETPSWFPDGKHLAIQSDRDGSWSIYVIDLDGNTVRRLTNR
jgi:TolB protein